MEESKVTNGEMREEAISETPEMAIISVPEKGELSIEQEIQKLEKNVELFNRIKVVSLKLTKESDWVFQRENSPYLMDRGAENIAIAWGIDISGVALRQEWADDEKGRYYTYVATGKAYSKKLGRYVEDIGVCSQRDKFFGMVGGEFKEIEAVDMANIRRKAVTNLYNRLIKRCVGLMNVTTEDLLAAKLDVKKIQGIQYRNGAQKGTADFSDKGKEVQKKLGEMLLMMANNDKAGAQKLLEEYSAWTDKDGKEHKAKSLKGMSEKWIMTTYGRVKKDFEASEKGPDERMPGEEG
jgi:hypothetical protein